jgi:hypothetical protein
MPLPQLLLTAPAQAILRSHAEFIYPFGLTLMEQTFSQWPNLLGTLFSQPPGTYISFPGVTVFLCVKKVQIGDVEVDVEAFRLEFSFPGLIQTHPPLVYYSPRQILAPGYVRQTLEESFKEELVAWILGKPRVNSLMLEHVRKPDLPDNCIVAEVFCLPSRSKTSSGRCDG